MKTVYVLAWGSYEYDVQGVTTDEKIAKQWEKFNKDCFYIVVNLIENNEQYEEFLNT